MLLCKTIDLDLEKESDVLENARETIAYLQNVVLAIETRALDGEKIENLRVVPGQIRRVITDAGVDYLIKVFGQDKVIRTIHKPITIGELEKLVSQEEMVALQGKGVVGIEHSKNKVIVVK
jgi:hypothetical protein